MLAVLSSRFIWWLFSVGIFFVPLQAQNTGRWITLKKDSTFIDSQGVFQLVVKWHSKDSFQKGEQDVHYKLNESRTHLIWLTPEKKENDSIWVQYQIIPSFIKRTYGNQPFRKAGINQIDPFSNLGSNSSIKSPFQSEESLNIDGILSRGISFGNNQNLVLNSGLNLRMNGTIGKDIEVEAAVTDEELPFQPEGTSATLQDFDRIYIQLSKGKHTLLLGDYAMNHSSQGYFLKYQKKNRGLNYQFKDDSSQLKKEYQVSLALARGRFSRNEINGIEGVQGPYRLTGARGEIFIIIISGTERIFLDGEKLERGLQADYTIDYNTGEIIFNPNHSITANSRIIAEFQYSDRFYTRSVLGLSGTWKNEKNTWYAAIFSEQDAKNQPIQQDLELFDSTLNKDARTILSEAGDNQNKAVMNASKVNEAFRTGIPNYIKIDSAGWVFFRYAEQADSNTLYYTVNFTFVGNGNGHYKLGRSAANGKIYVFVGELNGIKQGDYEPVQLLNFANRMTIAELGWKRNLNKNAWVKASGSWSSLDRNLFSNLQDADNSGFAGRAEYHYAKGIIKDHSLAAEVTSKHFQTVERFRSAEFNRLWNRTLFNQPMVNQNDQFITHQLKVEKDQKWGIEQFAGIYQNAQFQSLSEKLMGKYLFSKALQMRGEGELTLGKNDQLTQEFLRGILGLEGQFSSGYYKVTAEAEQSASYDSNRNLHPLSYGFNKSSALVGIRRKKWNIEGEGTYRLDYRADSTGWKGAAEAVTGGVNASIKGKPGRQLTGSIQYRALKALDAVWNQGTNNGTINTRLEYQFSKLLKCVSGNIFYQTLNGREQRRQYSYAEVPAGNGSFRWVDYNENGIKEINEFEESPFKDQARYIRIWIPTGEYINTRNISFSGNLLADSRFIKTAKNKEIKEGAFLWQWRSGWNLQGQTLPGKAWVQWAPFLTKLSDTGIAASRNLWRNVMDFQWGKGWNFQYSWVIRTQKSILTNGSDIRTNERHFILLRKEWGGKWMLNIQAEAGNGLYESEFFKSNNYRYEMAKTDPQLSLQLGNKWRFLIGGNIQYALAQSGEKMNWNEGNFQILRSLGNIGFIDSRVSFIQMKYNAKNNTPLANEIMQGFLPGRNMRINADWRFKASGNIQIILGYEGRRTGDIRMIHIGRAEARYLF